MKKHSYSNHVVHEKEYMSTEYQLLQECREQYILEDVENYLFKNNIEDTHYAY